MSSSRDNVGYTDQRRKDLAGTNSWLLISEKVLKTTISILILLDPKSRTCQKGVFPEIRA